MWRAEDGLEGLRYAPDVLRDRVAIGVNRSYGVWVALGLLLPSLASWWWFGTLAGAARGLIWGGMTRIFLVHNAMWSVASVCHLWGSRPYRTAADDRSRNCAWLAIPTFGESWHNNHHAFPTSARHGLEWWQLDINYLLIRLLHRLGAISEVIVPSAATKASKTAEVMHGD